MSAPPTAMQPYPETRPERDGLYETDGEGWLEPLVLRWRNGAWLSTVGGFEVTGITAWRPVTEPAQGSSSPRFPDPSPSR